MKSKFKLLGIALFSAVVLLSCYPNESLYYSELDAAITNYDAEFKFSDVKDIFFLDTVMHIVGKGETPEKGPYDDYIIAQVLSNLKKTMLGSANIHELKDSTDIPPGITPEIVVTIAVMETYYYTYYSYPWWGYWGSWGWGWYWKSGSLKSVDQTASTNYYYNPWYPWYPSGGVSYAYSIGSINIEFIDYKGVEDISLPVAWSGIANGIRSNSTQDEKNRIETQIKQCFNKEQSPYLY